MRNFSFNFVVFRVLLPKSSFVIKTTKSYLNSNINFNQKTLLYIIITQVAFAIVSESKVYCKGIGKISYTAE